MVDKVGALLRPASLHVVMWLICTQDMTLCVTSNLQAKLWWAAVGGDMSRSVRRWENGPVVHKPQPCSQSYWSCFFFFFFFLLVITTAAPQLIIIIIITHHHACLKLLLLSHHSIIAPKKRKTKNHPKKKFKKKNCSKSVRIFTSQQLLPKLVQPQD